MDAIRRVWASFDDWRRGETPELKELRFRVGHLYTLLDAERLARNEASIRARESRRMLDEERARAERLERQLDDLRAAIEAGRGDVRS